MTRSQSIPREAVPTVLSLARAGFGARRIAKMMEKHRVWTTKSSVHRLLTGQPPYRATEFRSTKDERVRMDPKHLPRPGTEAAS